MPTEASAVALGRFPVSRRSGHTRLTHLVGHIVAVVVRDTVIGMERSGKS